MPSKNILVVAGTHGNEINPVWAVNEFRNSKKLKRNEERIKFTIGNPLALEKGLRYVDTDLNRSFNTDQNVYTSYENKRANYLVNKYGLNGSDECQIAIDLHTTTASMGTSIVMYGRREKDFCLASILQNKFGLPIYLHDKDKSQKGFLVEAWPCGLVLEIGPVPQNYYDSKITARFLIVLDFLNDLVNNFENYRVKIPNQMTVYVHDKSIDYPRGVDLNIEGLIHPDRLNKDWELLKKGDPLFINLNGKTINYGENKEVYPVFIGEAAYREKNIAMSFTTKESINCSKGWIDNFVDSYA